MRVDIKKEFESKAAPQDELLQSAQQLLLGAAERDREMLAAAGLDHLHKEAMKDMGIELKRSEIFEKYGVQVILERDLRDLCIKYRLKCLSSKYYKGAIPPTLGADIARFIDKLDVPNAAHAAEYNLYVLAPHDAFQTVSYKVADVPKDPILLYKFSTGEGTFYGIVSKWGNDFTVMRRIQGWLMADSNRYAALLSTAIMSALTLVSYAATSSANGFYLFVAMSATVTIVHRVRAEMYWEDSSSRSRGREEIFSKDGWNVSSEHKHSKLFI